MKKFITNGILLLDFLGRLFRKPINLIVNEKDDYVYQSGILNSNKFESVQSESGTYDLIRIY